MDIVEGTVFSANVIMLHPFSHYMIVMLHPKYTEQAILLIGYSVLYTNTKYSPPHQAMSHV